MLKKKVTFNDFCITIDEPEDIQEDLRISRINNFLQHQIDRMLMGRMLSPILAKEHRYHIYRLINKIKAGDNH